MRSEALENIVTMLRSQAAERGDAEMTVSEWREAYDGLGALLPAAEGVAVEKVDAGGVPAEWIGTGDGPVVVYVHGGGYCIGSLDSHRSMLTHLASAVAGRVLAVDYRLAPEHPFPAALDDACTAYRWVVAGGASFLSATFSFFTSLEGSSGTTESSASGRVPDQAGGSACPTTPPTETQTNKNASL